MLDHMTLNRKKPPGDGKNQKNHRLLQQHIRWFFLVWTGAEKQKSCDSLLHHHDSEGLTHCHVVLFSSPPTQKALRRVVAAVASDDKLPLQVRHWSCDHLESQTECQKQRERRFNTTTFWIFTKKKQKTFETAPCFLPSRSQMHKTHQMLVWFWFMNLSHCGAARLHCWREPDKCKHGLAWNNTNMTTCALKGLLAAVTLLLFILEIKGSPPDEL